MNARTAEHLERKSRRSLWRGELELEQMRIEAERLSRRCRVLIATIRAVRQQLELVDSREESL